MKRYSLIAIFLASALAAAPLSLAANQPNIVIYMADDLGWGSTGPYGANPELVRTPHIDRLAELGIAFDDASTTGSVCSPTRYAMLTGRYSWRTSLKSRTVSPYGALLIDPATPTIGSWLQKRGYQTAHFGKWHLGYKADTFDNLLGEISPGPNDVGFDYHFGVPNNMDDLHKVYIENHGIFGLRSNRISPYGRSFYGKPYFGYDAPQRDEPEVMEELTDRATEWIRERGAGKPFFLYFASVAVHHPIMPSKRTFGSSPAGAYGDFIHEVDRSVGKLMGALEGEGLLEDTVFVFTSDNGGDIPGGNQSRPENQAIAAGLSLNGNWRGDKHTIYEGGFKVPFIVSYPDKVEGGRRSQAFVTTADLFATLVDIVGDEPPEPGVAPDSFLFATPLLVDPNAPSSRPHGVFRDVDGRQAVRFGPWKMIDSRVVDGEDKQIELYNLDIDPGKSRDVTSEHPDIIEKGSRLLNAIRDSGSSRKLAESQARPVMIGAYYYPWYRHIEEDTWEKWNQAMRLHLEHRQEPKLGLYDSSDPEVIGAHIAQSLQAGVDFWAVSWWGPGSPTDKVFREYILTHRDSSKIKYAILYESKGRFGNFDAPDYSKWVGDLEYFREAYFDHPSYLKIDGRPAIFVYLSRAYFRNRGEEALKDLREKFPEVYFIGDDVFYGRGEGEYKAEWAKNFDAVTIYDVYGQSVRWLGGTRRAIERLGANYAEAKAVANSVGTAFIPSIAPGYNDIGVRPQEKHPGRARYFTDVEGSTEGDLFRAMIRDVALPNLDPKAGNIFMITSFNEWYEDSQIEPTQGTQPPSDTDDSDTGTRLTEGGTYNDYGDLYLDILHEEVPHGSRLKVFP